jgi:hypothetical protein
MFNERLILNSSLAVMCPAAWISTHNLHIRADVGEDGGIDVKAFALALLATDEDGRALLLARLNVAPNTIVLQRGKHPSKQRSRGNDE